MEGSNILNNRGNLFDMWYYFADKFPVRDSVAFLRSTLKSELQKSTEFYYKKLDNERILNQKKKVHYL